MSVRASGAVERRVVAVAAIGFLALAVSGLILARNAGAAGTPAVQITPNHGPLASTVTVVTGQNFAPGESVSIYRDTRPFFGYITDASGSFVGAPHPLIGPAPVSGIVTITATGQKSGLKAKTIFTVTK